jgi:hypothetical protein
MRQPFYIAARGVDVFCDYDECPEPLIRVEPLPLIAMVRVDDVNHAIYAHAAARHAGGAGKTPPAPGVWPAPTANRP